jgi:hypothetical protein
MMGEYVHRGKLPAARHNQPCDLIDLGARFGRMVRVRFADGVEMWVARLAVRRARMPIPGDSCHADASVGAR